MKKLILMLIILMASSPLFSSSSKPIVDVDAPHHRLDKVDGVPDHLRKNNGSWELGEWHDGDWGNSTCSKPGRHCQLGDTETWWYSVEPPAQGGTIRGEDKGRATIIRWNSLINDYDWGY